MVNKKDCFICNLTLFFLCMIFSAFIVYFFIPFVFSEQEFKITKDECWNETFYDIDFDGQRKLENLEYYYYGIGCDYIKELNISSIMCDEYEKIIKDVKDSIKPSEEIITEFCEEIEVNEINHTIDALEDSPSVIEFWEYYCIDNYDINKEECDEMPRYFEVPILKEELVMSFLDRYCIVTSLNCDGDYIMEQIDYNKEDRFCCFHDKIIGTGICGDSLINKYKCEFKEEYFVEVLK